MSPSVSTGGQDTVVRQVWLSVAIQTPVNCHCQLEEHLGASGEVIGESTVAVVPSCTVVGVSHFLSTCCVCLLLTVVKY